MPDRIIRDELLDSERWVGLSDDTCKLAYVAILLRCDALGNYPADLFRLRRLWRDLQIGTDEIAAKRLNELADHGLVQLYDADGKRFLHIPRFRQRLRYVKRIYPPSPWTSDQEKQHLEKYSPDYRLAQVRSAPVPSQALACLSPPEVKRSEVKLNTKSTSAAPPVDNSAPTWTEHWQARGKSLGIQPNPGESTREYCKRVSAHVKGQ